MLERRRSIRQLDSTPGRRTGRSRRPEPEPASRLTVWLFALLVLSGLGIIVSRLSDSSPDATPEPLAAEPQPAPPPPPPPPPPSRPPPVGEGLVTAPTAAPPPTPALDRMVRLEARRRILRAGQLVYLDSLLAESDSMFWRWPDRRGGPLWVALVQDSLFEAVQVDPSPVREALTRWQTLPLGFRFAVMGDTTSAEIVVRWIDQFAPADLRTGETHIEVASDGSIQRAHITLALRDPAGTPLRLPDLLAAAMHEVGHALGLGHSAQSGDVMYPSPRSGSLSPRDRRTAELIYGLPPGSVKGGA